MNANVEVRDDARSATDLGIQDDARKVRPFYWLLRRELWENRSIYVAPIAVALPILLAALVNIVGIARNGVVFDQSGEFFRLANLGLYGLLIAAMAITAALVTWFYCLDALHGERRDRSILFWKSLPVSDTKTVLSKLLVAQLVIPLIAILTAYAAYLLLWIVGSLVLVFKGVRLGLLLANTPIGELFAMHLYMSIVATLWFLPLNAWLLFVSSWARRAALLWAILVPGAIALAEYVAFGTNWFAALLQERLSGGLEHAFDSVSSLGLQLRSGGENMGFEGGFDPSRVGDSLLDALTPGNFLAQPGLWIGIIAAGMFVAGSIWMRRSRPAVTCQTLKSTPPTDAPRTRAALACRGNNDTSSSLNHKWLSSVAMTAHPGRLRQDAG